MKVSKYLTRSASGSNIIVCCQCVGGCSGPVGNVTGFSPSKIQSNQQAKPCKTPFLVILNSSDPVHNKEETSFELG